MEIPVPQKKVIPADDNFRTNLQYILFEHANFWRNAPKSPKSTDNSVCSWISGAVQEETINQIMRSVERYDRERQGTPCYSSSYE